MRTWNGGDMNLCDTGHDEICFLGIECPACHIKDDMGSEILNLKEKICDLQMREAGIEPVFEKAGEAA